MTTANTRPLRMALLANAALSLASAGVIDVLALPGRRPARRPGAARPSDGRRWIVTSGRRAPAPGLVLTSDMARFRAADRGRWYEVLPCPDPEAVVRARAAEEQRARQEQRAQSVASQLADPLRAEIVMLGRSGRRVEAIRRVASAIGEDLAIARRVVELVVPRGP